MKSAIAGVLCACALSQTAFAARDVMDVADLVETQGPAVVNISTTKLMKSNAGQPGIDEVPEIFRRFFPDMPAPNQGPRPRPRDIPARGEGSGFIVNSDGTILTNAHVVAGADEVVVKLTDKRKFTAKVIGSDARTDVAVLKITATNLPTVKLGDPSKLRVGEAVAAIGAPFGFENSVTAGIVSAKGRSLPSDSYVPFIQTDVAINPGNSGGPLFNMRGEVVGINSQIYSRSGGYQGVSFAIPVDLAMQVADQLKGKGKVARGWLGVSIQEVTSDLADSFGLDRPRGALIAQVMEDSPAEKAGLEASDVVLKFDGKPIEESGDLPRIVGMTKPGNKVAIEVWRKGQAKTLSIVPGDLPGDKTAAADGDDGVDKSGLGLAELSAAQRRELKLDHGVLVEEASGDAARAGIQVGDVLLAVNNTQIKTIADFKKAVAAVPKGKIAAILVRRGQGSLYIPLRLAAGE